MASLSDIPVALLEPAARMAFIAWLRRHPVDSSTRRRLVKLWREATGANWTAQDYEDAGLLNND